MQHHRNKAAELVRENDDGWIADVAETVADENDQELAAEHVAIEANRILDQPYFGSGSNPYRLLANGSVVYTENTETKDVVKYGDVGYQIVANSHFGVDGLDRHDVRCGLVGTIVSITEELAERHENEEKYQ
jgi:hypothetical protein